MIVFEGTCNKPCYCVNSATFRYPDGREVMIDRDDTDYYRTIDGRFKMFWTDCYLFDDEHISFLTEKDYEELKNAEFVEFDDDDVGAIIKVTNVEFIKEENYETSNNH